MKFLEWFSKIGDLLMKVSDTLLIISEFLTGVALRFPTLVDFLYDGVSEIFDLKDRLLNNGVPPDVVDEAVEKRNKELVLAAQEQFHGSGPQVSTQLIKQTVEGIVAVVKADRYGRTQEFATRDEHARNLGYLRSPDLEAAKKAYPQLFGISR